MSMGVDLIQEWERMDEVLAWSESLPKKSRFFFLKVLESKKFFFFCGQK
jgi:hypothetical protein